jgi:hypothetical protein
MFKLWIVQAEHGDCFIVEYGTRKDTRYMLIDGGPREVYASHLRAQIERIQQAGGRLDQVVLSHIDDDHARGLLDFLKDLQEQDRAGQHPPIEIGELWHNTFSQALGGETAGLFQSYLRQQAEAAATRDLSFDRDTFLLDPQARDIAQGDRLTRQAEALAIPINPGFSSGMISVGDRARPIPRVNLRVHIVGPLRKNLDRLEKEWKAWLKKQEDRIAKGQVERALDTSYPNLSSLMFLVDGDGKTILFTGDGRGDHLLEGLKSTGLLGRGKDARLHVDVLKLPHHGSMRNATQDFFRTVTAGRYVISANGKYGNPDLNTLQWIVETAKEDGRKIEIWVTNETDLTDEFRKKHDPAVYGYTWKALPPGEHAMLLDLAPDREIDRIRMRPLVSGQSVEPVDSVIQRPLVSGQSVEPVDSVTQRPLVSGQSVEPAGSIAQRPLVSGQRAEPGSAETAGEPEAAPQPVIQVLTSTPGRAPASKRALLVGINVFPTLTPGETLRGCVNDTAELRSLLTQFYGFDNQEIRILCDSEATTQGIKDGLGWLLSDYAGSDVRLFHFSSHGTRVADQNNDEYEGKDEVIVTYDHSWARPFRDDHLFEIFNTIPQNVNFTFVADCCHSGTIQKGLLDKGLDFKPRYVVPPPDVEDAIFELRRKRDLQSREYVAEKIQEEMKTRDISRDELLALIEKYEKGFKENTYKNVIAADRHILLAGCEDRQTSADARIEGVYRGAFTWAIGKSIREANGSLTYSELIRQVMAHLRHEFEQIPQLECPGDFKNMKLFSPL